MFHDEFAAERLKSLFAGLLAEFRTQTSNMALTEEEQQHYNLLNEKRGDQLLMKLNVFASVGKRQKPNNLHIIGANGDDLRTFVIHAYQLELLDQDLLEDECAKIDPLQYSTRVI